MCSTGIKQNLNRFAMDREGTRHKCCSLRNSDHRGEVKTTLLDLHGLLLPFVFVVLRLSPSLILLPGLRTCIHEMPGFPTIVAASFIVGAGWWGCIWPSILLLKIWVTEIPLLLILGRFCHPSPERWFRWKFCCAFRTMRNLRLGALLELNAAFLFFAFYTFFIASSWDMARSTIS
jgi:hypothetical protein